MVVVRHGVKTTLQRIVLHIPLLLLCTISLSVLGVGGPVYLGVTLAVGAVYLGLGDQGSARRVRRRRPLGGNASSISLTYTCS